MHYFHFCSSIFRLLRNLGVSPADNKFEGRKQSLEDMMAALVDARGKILEGSKQPITPPIASITGDASPPAGSIREGLEKAHADLGKFRSNHPMGNPLLTTPEVKNT
jgi:hypothetical protein